MESRKMELKNLFAGQQWRNRHREQTYGHGEREERKLTLPCVKPTAGNELLYNAGS